MVTTPTKNWWLKAGLRLLTSSVVAHGSSSQGASQGDQGEPSWFGSEPCQAGLGRVAWGQLKIAEPIELRQVGQVAGCKRDAGHVRPTGLREEMPGDNMS